MDKKYEASAILVKSTTKEYRVSGYLLKQNIDIGYTASAMLIGITQCQVPGAITLPTLSSIGVQIEGNNVPQLLLLPTLSSIDIRTKSC